MQIIIEIIGALVFVSGIFFVLQSRKIANFPKSSVMVGNPVWTPYGLAIASLGLIIFLAGFFL